MPLCQLCHAREASLFFTRIINGEKTELQVCRKCAASSSGIKLDVNNLLAGLSKLGKEAFEKAEAMRTCDSCGMTLEEFNKTGLMGCSHCYEAFSDHVDTLLNRVHGNVRHQGKRPSGIEPAEPMTSTEHYANERHPHMPDAFASAMPGPESIDKLKMELKAAIMEEAYERAAQIRDRIRALEHPVEEAPPEGDASSGEEAASGGPVSSARDAASAGDTSTAGEPGGAS